MKKIFHCTLIIILIISCEKQVSINQKYSDFQIDLTDLEKRNLYGKVQEYTLYITHFNESGKPQAENPKLINKEIFTEFGSIQFLEDYDINGEIKRSEAYFYDKNNKLTKTITKIGPTTSVDLFKRDSINKTETRRLFVNDIEMVKDIRIYGKNDKIIKEIEIRAVNGDTVVRNYNYKFDSNNNIIRYDFDTNNIDKKNTREYKYDENGNMIQKIYYDAKNIRKINSEYKNNILTKIKEYKVSSDSTETLAYIKEYDKDYNVTSINVFKDSKLYRETKIEYVFDKFGNWIEKKTYTKRNYRGSNSFHLATLATRKIKYWE
ncbi:hypothetical protein ACGK9U_01210 [Mariniflexile sp. HNIBRBA6329]|uniref:hypothetical protein n=1 Tax=Mariniflexile sp. HNIBRBA6329 TaxID=3373088 RepID=UPI003746CD29